MGEGGFRHRLFQCGARGCDYHQGYDDAMAESADSPRPPF